MEHGWHIITYFIAPLLRFVAYTLNMSTDELEAPAMRENIETVDHLVEKCIAVFSEVKVVSYSFFEGNYSCKLLLISYLTH